ncbi:MAG: tetratricopeptide repeat protein [Thermodesulfobacteriota bacterium]|nr:tetratricopeptide repeat protein [Thermodesulfobacteriota bacterium]
MKRFNAFFILLFALFCFACAGGNSAKKMPEHITAGTKEMAGGIARYNKGCYKDSLEYFCRAHELFVASDQLSGVAMSLNNIGNVYRITGDFNSALLFFDEAFAIYSDMGDPLGGVQVLSNKVAALIDGGRPAQAEKVLNIAEEMAKKNRILFGPLLTNKGIILIKKMEYSRAEELMQTALANTDPENLLEFATVNFGLGNLMFETQRYEKAIDFFKTALKADRLSGFNKSIADDLAAIGSACLKLGEDELAVNFLKRSVEIYALIGNHKKVQNIMEKLEMVSGKTGSDLTITKHFVNIWLEGKALESPCE